MTSIDDLKRLAEAATNEWQGIADFVFESGIHQIDINFIAACSPERILQMIAVIEAAKDALSDGAGRRERKVFDAALVKLEQA